MTPFKIILTALGAVGLLTFAAYTLLRGFLNLIIYAGRAIDAAADEDEGEG